MGNKVNTHLSSTNIEFYVQNLLTEIEVSKWKPDVIIGVSRGGLLPGVMLSHALNTKFIAMQTQFEKTPMKVNVYKGTQEAIMCLDTIEKYDSKILVVDDINDTGKTFDIIKYELDHALKDENGEDGPPCEYFFEYKLASVIELHDSIVKCDFVGWRKERDPNEWFVFPWESLTKIEDHFKEYEQLKSDLNHYVIAAHFEGQIMFINYRNAESIEVAKNDFLIEYLSRDNACEKCDTLKIIDKNLEVITFNVNEEVNKMIDVLQEAGVAIKRDKE